MIDPAQAGGLLGKVDAMFADASGIEVNRSLQFSRLRPDTPLEQLFLIGRSADPVDWTNVNELDALRWLGCAAAVKRVPGWIEGVAGCSDARQSEAELAWSLY
eukprot:3030207-Rhodomonas_salina.2